MDEIKNYYNHYDEDGDIPFENYIKIDNNNLSAEETAKMIKERFNL